MPQDAWRRAYMLSRSRQGGSAGAGPGSQQGKGAPRPPRVRRAQHWGCILGYILLILLISAGISLWLYRWYWVPRYREQLPAPVRQAVTEPRASIDLAALDSGLGCQLIQFADYLPFIDATRQWGVEWELAQTGGGTGRLSAPGVIVYTQDGLILTYSLDLEVIFGSDQWEQWWPTLRDAGLWEAITITALTGSDEMPSGHSELKYEGHNQTQLKQGWAVGQYVLHFDQGWLKRIVTAIDFNSVSDS